jgi:hypothetical protein
MYFSGKVHRRPLVSRKDESPGKVVFEKLLREAIVKLNFLFFCSKKPVNFFVVKLNEIHHKVAKLTTGTSVVEIPLNIRSLHSLRH